ncbi:cytochrome b/b6 domain-containing protein [Chitinimonas sp. BJYL2]|uniref:cytochrome b/b6 domain-containing protein n=1 Tax=Chitinimonas sp. BJYL2 TaxID=2976696 RepID=UPI0022B3C720|nr:cytochrome b/b6 domain-containing protein [Chitinimonas sp. BJYL2]
MNAVSPTARVAVWDPLVRLTHWTVALLVLGNFLNEDGETWHRYAGYTVVALVLIRLVWGWVGPGHARLWTELPTPQRITAYVSALWQGKAPRYLGHNPLGMLMMLALWSVLLGLGLTGWLMGTDMFWGEEWVEEIHEALANSLMVLVPLHVLAAIMASLHERDNLIAAMVHGKKSVSNDHVAAP